MVLSHDKPGCGGSPGDWRTQDFAERAEESLAALELLRAQPGVDPERVGLLGISQGGWICQQAAAVGGTAVAFIVTISGRGNPRCSRSATASARLSTTRSRPWPGSTSGPVADDAPERILADQLAYADRPWFTTATEFAYETTDLLTFAIRAGFDPVEVLPQVRCPVFAAFGGGDSTVPVQSRSRPTLDTCRTTRVMPSSSIPAPITTSSSRSATHPCRWPGSSRPGSSRCSRTDWAPSKPSKPSMAD